MREERYCKAADFDYIQFISLRLPYYPTMTRPSLTPSPKNTRIKPRYRTREMVAQSQIYTSSRVVPLIANTRPTHQRKKERELLDKAPFCKETHLPPCCISLHNSTSAMHAAHSLLPLIPPRGITFDDGTTSFLKKTDNAALIYLVHLPLLRYLKELTSQ